MSASAYFFAGVTMQLHLTGAQTGGKFCLLEALIPPGHMTPPHMHNNEDEGFLILEGELDVIVDGKRNRVRAGESAFAPRGVPHQLHNAGDRPVRAIGVTTPAGFGDFVMAAGEPAGAGEPPPVNPEALVPIAARFGIQIPA
jgi:mannose-6-phosphate isomerase-like protein (cupin superfamily)